MSMPNNKLLDLCSALEPWEGHVNFGPPLAQHGSDHAYNTNSLRRPNREQHVVESDDSCCGQLWPFCLS